MAKLHRIAYGLFVVVFVILLFAPFVLMALQFLAWLRFGNWPSWTGSMLFGFVQTDWMGFNTIANWLLSQQLWLLSGIAAGLLLWAATIAEK